MNKKEFFLMLKGALVFGLALIILSLTIIYSEFFIIYSGIFTFYSLVLIIIIFILGEIIKKDRRKREDKSKLIAISEEIKLLEEQVDFFETLIQGIPPIHAMNYLDEAISMLPVEIENKSTSKLRKMMFFADDKVDTLNGIRDKIWEIVWNKDEKEIKEIAKRPIIQNAVKEVEKAIKDLKQKLKEIKDELKKWEVY